MVDRVRTITNQTRTEGDANKTRTRNDANANQIGTRNDADVNQTRAGDDAPGDVMASGAGQIEE